LISHVLKEVEKQRVFKTIEEGSLDIGRFAWGERRIGLRKFSVLLFKPKRYYFVFHKKNREIIAKTFFPNWGRAASVQHKEMSDPLEKQLRSWIDSIVRVDERQRQLLVSVEVGVKTRRTFARVAEKVRTGYSKKNS